MADELCPICRKKMPPEDLSHLTRWGLVVYSFDRDKNGETIHHHYEDQIVCSKECMVAALEGKAKIINPREEWRVCLVLSTMDGKEMLESLARLLRSVR